MSRKNPYRKSRVQPVWRQAEPWVQTRADNWRVVREILGGLAVVALWFAIVGWVWL